VGGDGLKSHIDPCPIKKGNRCSSIFPSPEFAVVRPCSFRVTQFTPHRYQSSGLLGMITTASSSTSSTCSASGNGIVVVYTRGGAPSPAATES